MTKKTPEALARPLQSAAARKLDLENIARLRSERATVKTTWSPSSQQDCDEARRLVDWGRQNINKATGKPWIW